MQKTTADGKLLTKSYSSSAEGYQKYRQLTYPFGMSESSLFPGSFSVCCLIFSSRPAASAPWYWSTLTLFLKNKNVGVAEMLLAAAVAWGKENRFSKMYSVSNSSLIGTS